MSESAIAARRKAALEDGAESYVARRKEIIQAAALVFRDRGLEAATLRDVATALGTDRASLYYYVGSKDEILQEIFRETLGRDIAAAGVIKRSRAASREKIGKLVTSMVASYSDNYPAMNVYIQDLGRIARQDSDWAVDIVARTRTYVSIVESILEKGRRDGTLRTDLPAELCAYALFGMINWMHRWYRTGIEWSPQKIADSYTEIFLDGYGARLDPR